MDKIKENKTAIIILAVFLIFLIWQFTDNRTNRPQGLEQRVATLEANNVTLIKVVNANIADMQKITQEVNIQHEFILWAFHDQAIAFDKMKQQNGGK